MVKHTYTILAAALLLASCEKEISIDYPTVDPIYVVEGAVTNEEIAVLVTRTRDMQNGEKPAGEENAVVTINTTGLPPEILRYGEDGYYRSAGSTKGVAGQSYTLSVAVGGKEFTSESTMNPAVGIEYFIFRWQKIITEQVLFCTLSFEDIAGEENYYCYRIRRNGENYRWNILTDRGNDGRKITVDIFCMSETMAKENRDEDREDILYEGDEIEVELQTIDRRTYDYLYSLRLSERTSSNPIDNFTGGCLGYFSAYSTTRYETVFSYDSIK